MSETFTELKRHCYLLRCVEAGGPFELGKTYYARTAHRQGDAVTMFDVCLDGVDGEVRTEYDTRFVPANKENWWLFSKAQRDRYNIPAATAHKSPRARIVNFRKQAVAA